MNPSQLQILQHTLGRDQYGDGAGDGIEAEYTAQSAAVDVRGNSGTGPRSLPTQAEADEEIRKINEE